MKTVKSKQEKLNMLCRRGLKELDLILKTYLDKYYQSASIEELSQFEALLQLDDHSLLALILKPPTNISSAETILYNKLQQYNQL